MTGESGTASTASGVFTQGAALSVPRSVPQSVPLSVPLPSNGRQIPPIQQRSAVGDSIRTSTLFTLERFPLQV